MRDASTGGHPPPSQADAPPRGESPSLSGTAARPPLAALVLVAALSMVALLGPTRALVPWALLPWTAAFLALVLLWLRHPAWLERPGILLGGALLLRILFLLTQQDLSDDLFRYVWDGWIRTHGILPYRFPPADPALVALRDPVLFPALNSPGYHSIYPPLSQLVFLVGGWIHAVFGWPASGWSVRVGFTLLETLGVAALLLALRRGGRPVAPLVLYAWNPLVLLAVAGSGHSEGGLVLGVGLLLAGLTLRRPGVAWGGWVLAVLSKGLPLLLFPLLWRAITRQVGARASARHLVLAGGGGLLLSLPFLRPDDLPRVWESAQLYVHLFAFNEGLPALLRRLGLPALLASTPLELAPTLRGVALAGAAWIGLRHPVETPGQVARGAFLVLGLYLVLATTVHPWYLLWVLPLLPLFPPDAATGRLSLLWASWAALATYLFYEGVPALPLALLFWGGMLGWWVVEERERFFRPLRRPAGRRKARWLAPWVEGTTVLDVGGGEGHLARSLARTGPFRVTILDPGPLEGWDAGPRKRGDEGPLEGGDEGRDGDGVRDVGGVSFLRGEGERLPFPDGSFDTVILSFVLHHAHDADQLLAQALRVARGRVLVLESTWEGPLERAALHALDRFVNRGRPGEWGAPLDLRRPSEWEALARRLGARIERGDRPRGAVHRVHRLVLIPGDGGGQRG